MPRKWENFAKIPSPVRPSKLVKDRRKITFLFLKFFFLFGGQFGANLAVFGVRIGEGFFLSWFFPIFRVPGRCKGKNDSQSTAESFGQEYRNIAWYGTSPIGQEKSSKAVNPPAKIIGMRLFAYSWKLPAYSGAFLLTVDNFSFFTYSWSFFTYSFSFFTYSWSFFRLQWESAPNKHLKGLQAKKLNCKQKSSNCK